MRLCRTSFPPIASRWPLSVVRIELEIFRLQTSFHTPVWLAWEKLHRSLVPSELLVGGTSSVKEHDRTILDDSAVPVRSPAR